MARRASHTPRRFAIDGPPDDAPAEEVAAQLLEDWRRTRPDAEAWRGRERPADPAPAGEAGDAAEYRVERLTASGGPALRAAARLQAELTARAAEGWRLCAIVPAPPNDQLAIYERVPDHAEQAAAAGPSRSTRARRARKRAAGAREWDAARERFAVERAGDLAELVTRPSRRALRRPAAPEVRRRRATALALATVGVMLLAAVAFSGDDEPSLAPAVPSAQDSEPSRADRGAAATGGEQDIPRCGEVRTGGAPVTCATSTRVLTIGGLGRAVKVDGVKNRVLGVRHEPGAVVVRLGVRNESDAAIDLMDVPGRASLVAGSARLSPAAGVPSTIVTPGHAADTELRFAATEAFKAAALRRAGRADLGIGGIARAAVLRLVVPPAG
jgi:hypothetical protein